MSSKKRVLIYDDDPDILILCQTLLKNRGHEVALKSVCENVVNDMIEFNPDVVLMDLWIPEIGGEKAIQKVKTNDKVSSVPIYVFSANAEIMEISKRIGADGHVSKPFDVHDFLLTIENS